MLVLSRKSGQSIVIGDSVTVTVLETTKKTIRLGIQAPPHVRIFRQEVQHQARRKPLPALKVTELT
jgi:carbon storage regulator